MKILVIEDSELIRTMLKDCIKKAGHELIGEAEDGEEGFEKFKELKPDLVILDITLPGMNGIEWLEAKNEHDEFMRYSDDQKVKVLVCSALQYKEVVLEATKLGAVDYFIKPFKDEELISKLKEIQNM